MEAGFSRVVHTAEWAGRHRFMGDRELRRWERLAAWKAHDACERLRRVSAGLGWAALGFPGGRGAGGGDARLPAEEFSASQCPAAPHWPRGVAHKCGTPGALCRPLAGGRPILLARVGRAMQLVKPERYDEFVNALVSLVHRGLTTHMSNAPGSAEQVRRGQEAAVHRRSSVALGQCRQGRRRGAGPPGLATAMLTTCFSALPPPSPDGGGARLPRRVGHGADAPHGPAQEVCGDHDAALPGAPAALVVVVLLR